MGVESEPNKHSTLLFRKMAQFPALYGEAANGKMKIWSIRVYEKDALSVIESEYGFEDGKKQMQQKYITEGKNIGKKNETTPLQQAINEARATWIKKRESGYAPRDVADVAPTEETGDEKDGSLPPSPELTSRDKGKASDLSVPFPMLAQTYEDRKHNMTWPCYVQPKLDGVRCLGIPGKGMFSRQRKPFKTLAHIQAEVDLFPGHWILDGELYSDTLTFQEIVGIVKKEKPSKEEAEKQAQIKYHVYDVLLPDNFKTRYVNLALRIRRMSLHTIQLVDTAVCEKEEDMMEKHGKYVAEGYEGIMLRNSAGLYRQAPSASIRSVDLQKYKQFKDGEFKIVGFTEGASAEEGCVIWVCATEDGHEFNCRPRGTREERMELFEAGEDYVGKMLSVRYQELTDDGVPRFPVGIAVRDYE